jgi:glycosyltransferase involved in cell wall biosynthesis
MKVLQMGPYPPPHGGVQTNLVAIRRFLLARGIPCAVINLTRYRSDESDGIYYPKNALEVMKLLARLKYDIIHMHIGGNLSPRLLMLGLTCCLMPRSKTVLTFHSGGYPLSDGGKSAGHLTFRGFVLRRFDRVIGVNRELEQLFRKFGVAGRRIRLINPYALISDTSEASLPNNLAGFFQNHSPRILTVSGLEPEYDIPLQIDVLGSVRKRFPDAGLVIIGSGSLEPEISKMIKSKSYAEHILLCGDVSHPITLRAIVESDLSLRTTHYDGDSISVREALMAGTPVIATDNGMRPEGTHLIPGPDHDALLQAIEKLLSNGAALNKKLHHQDTGEGNIEEVFELYQELLKD